MKSEKNLKQKGIITMTEDEMWKALVSCDKSYDGQFFYGVKSTGIFCRPSCASRTPLRKNVVYFHTAEEALKAGFHPCKRCRPDLLVFTPALDIAREAKEIMDRAYNDSSLLAQKMTRLGITRNHLDKIFKNQYQESLKEYLNRLRIQKAKGLLSEGVPISDTAWAIGMNSLSGFYSFFKKETGLTPADYQHHGHRKDEPPMYHTFYRSPIGTLVIRSTEEAIIGISPLTQEIQASPRENQLTLKCTKELDEYFSGTRKTFDIPLAPKGTPFQQAVWKAVCEIPYGSTHTYGEIAKKVGSPKAYRAVGMSNHKNPILILIPCHRVIGSQGNLTGYAAGLKNKQYLLEMEKRNRGGEQR
ncbi:bifunctional transcriptional activator/DNA repair enzyme AdaA [Megasphaera sp. WILCCON 0056]|uniref:bifunctional transcriptional activator/DNA repair enzyme AdaA n=1 Tax=Megasphaera sp. WILCCON 0056 TaxID=3345340 RepID=UPI003A7F97FC